MSDNNSLGQSQLASQHCNAVYGLQGSFGGLWGSLLGSIGSTGQGAANMLFSSYKDYESYCYSHFGATPEPDADGWYNWEDYSPPRDALIVVWREGWDKWDDYDGCRAMFPRESSPFFNIAGLKWKFTGIAKEQGYGK